MSKSEPALYIKGDLDIVNGVVTADLQDVQIGRLNIPTGQVAQVEEFLVYYTQKVIDPPNLTVSNFNVGVQSCDVQASVPNKVSFAP